MESRVSQGSVCDHVQEGREDSGRNLELQVEGEGRGSVVSAALNWDFSVPYSHNLLSEHILADCYSTFTETIHL